MMWHSWTPLLSTLAHLCDVVQVVILQVLLFRQSQMKLWMLLLWYLLNFNFIISIWIIIHHHETIKMRIFVIFAQGRWAEAGLLAKAVRHYYICISIRLIYVKCWVEFLCELKLMNLVLHHFLLEWTVIDIFLGLVGLLLVGNAHWLMRGLDHRLVGDSLGVYNWYSRDLLLWVMGWRKHNIIFLIKTIKILQIILKHHVFSLCLWCRRRFKVAVMWRISPLWRLFLVPLASKLSVICIKWSLECFIVL